MTGEANELLAALAMLARTVVSASIVQLAGHQPGQRVVAVSGDSCPARYGRGAEIGRADFRFVADRCVTGPDGALTMTEILAWFRPPGDDADEDGDVLMAAELEVPVGSPIDQLAQAVQSDPDGAMVRVGE